MYAVIETTVRRGIHASETNRILLKINKAIRKERLSNDYKRCMLTSAFFLFFSSIIILGLVNTSFQGGGMYEKKIYYLFIKCSASNRM